MATRPMLNTASSRLTASGSREREWSVDVVVASGTHTSTAGSNASGTPVTVPPAAMTTPP